MPQLQSQNTSREEVLDTRGQEIECVQGPHPHVVAARAGVSNGLPISWVCVPRGHGIDTDLESIGLDRDGGVILDGLDDRGFPGHAGAVLVLELHTHEGESGSLPRRVLDRMLDEKVPSELDGPKYQEEENWQYQRTFDGCRAFVTWHSQGYPHLASPLVSDPGWHWLPELLVVAAEDFVHGLVVLTLDRPQIPTSFA